MQQTYQRLFMNLLYKYIIYECKLRMLSVFLLCLLYSILLNVFQQQSKTNT